MNEKEVREQVKQEYPDKNDLVIDSVVQERMKAGKPDETDDGKSKDATDKEGATAAEVTNKDATSNDKDATSKEGAAPTDSEPKESHKEDTSKEDTSKDDNEQKIVIPSEDYKKKYEEVSERYEEALKYAGNQKRDEKIAKIEKLAGNGIDLQMAARLVNDDPNNLDDWDALILQYQIENPHYAGHDDLVRSELHKKYGYEEGEFDSSSDKTKMSIDAKAARDVLNDKTSVEVESGGVEAEIKKQQEQRETESKQRKSDWDNLSKEGFIPNFKKINIPMGDDIKTIEVSDVDAKKYADFFMQTGSTSEMNEESVQVAFNMARERYVIDHLPDILKGVADKAVAEYREQRDKDESNPRAEVGDKRDNVQKDAAKIKAQQQIEEYYRKRGIK